MAVIYVAYSLKFLSRGLPTFWLGGMGGQPAPHAYSWIRHCFSLLAYSRPKAEIF